MKNKNQDKFLDTVIFSFTYRDIATLLQYEIQDRGLKVVPSQSMIKEIAERISFDGIDEAFNNEAQDQITAELDSLPEEEDSKPNRWQDYADYNELRTREAKSYCN